MDYAVTYIEVRRSSTFAQVGVSPSAYLSNEENPCRPLINVFAPVATLLGLEVDEVLSLYPSVTFFA